MASPELLNGFVAAGGRNGFTQSRSAVRTMGSVPRLSLRGLTVLLLHLRDVLVVAEHLLWEPSLNRPSGGSFTALGPDELSSVYEHSLTMMYQGVRGALAADDALSELGKECRFRVRETPEWKVHAADLEAEMRKRGMVFEVIDWTEVQPSLPFEG